MEKKKNKLLLVSAVFGAAFVVGFIVLFVAIDEAPPLVKLTLVKKEAIFGLLHLS